MSKESWLLFCIGGLVCLVFTHFIFDTMVKEGLLDKHNPTMKKAIFMTTYILSPVFMIGFLFVVLKGIYRGYKNGTKEIKTTKKED